MSNKKKIDVTSIVMTAVFVTLVIGAAVAVFCLTLNKNDTPAVQESLPVQDVDEAAQNLPVAPKDVPSEGSLTAEDIRKIIPNAEPGQTYTYIDDGEVKTVTMPLEESPDTFNVQETVAKSKYKFTQFTDLTDKFMQACKDGNVEEMYALYYGDLLERQRLSNEALGTKQVFDEAVKARMATFVDFMEFEYGSIDMPPTQSAAYYANLIYSRANNGNTIPVPAEEITNCVNLRLYVESGGFVDHMLAQIGGYWYVVA